MKTYLLVTMAPVPYNYEVKADGVSIVENMLVFQNADAEAVGRVKLDAVLLCVEKDRITS